MFSCQNKHSVPSTCELILADPPVDIHASHYYSKAAANATVYFFVGDSQAHSFDGSPSKADNAKAVNLTLTRMMSDVLKRFGGSAANIVWTAGNNDGPHDSIFKQQDNATQAWAGALLAANVVTDDLGVKYTSSFSETEVFSQTDVFKLVGFYMKALPALTNRSYAIVLNTNLGGDNPAQQSYLEQSLDWVHRTHGDAGIVYVLGHHPEVMSVGTDVVPEAYRPMVKGVFCGHNHVAMSTSSKLFTNVGGLTFSSVPRPHNFLIAQVDADHPESIVCRTFRYASVSRLLEDAIEHDTQGLDCGEQSCVNGFLQLVEQTCSDGVPVAYTGLWVDEEAPSRVDLDVLGALAAWLQPPPYKRPPPVSGVWASQLLELTRPQCWQTRSCVVLDFGCGDGEALRELGSHLHADASQLHCIEVYELNDTAGQYVRHVLPDPKDESAYCEAAAALVAPLREASTGEGLALIFSSVTFHHLPTSRMRACVYALIAAALGPRGAFVLHYSSWRVYEQQANAAGLVFNESLQLAVLKEEPSQMIDTWPARNFEAIFTLGSRAPTDVAPVVTRRLKTSAVDV
ncbi:hypothetical protein Ctob_000495 [Chrysochromulina tobinii]|uniref:Calcineurin-like phosphoesterase domain-containing protein n=1 Tax=Chrysochromulina tobinii TaxID=1460289 RepID=A0A0M0J3W3_9EUKA|nr:hypothetical protein Ctob_000495 [Chrysochromulina tobinii]|eukprot:KOO21264.1 hypothetical protein Ctob_000495 [Chrysochromulina sp. CCMP291]